MRTKLSILLTITMILALIPMSAFALEPVDPIEQMMYANDVEYGDALPINISSYTDYHHLRLDPANALGEFDAVQSAGGIANANFFGLAAREWTEYIFEERFCNVDWETDIQFAEVTWGGANTWHPEAAKVYLTGAMVDGELETEAYYVGIVWNRIGVNYISAADRLAIAEGYSPEVGRELATSELQTEGVIEITGFNLPAQVESAAGIRLIDITHEIFDTPTTSTVSFSTYTNGAGGRFTVNSLPLVYPNDGNVTIVDINPAGNTDGFDLDAIRVWKCVPIEEEYGFCGYKLDAETGLGLGGWTIIATDEHGEEWTTETGSDGKYCFTDLPAGVYTVEEVMEDGWQQVFPDGNGIHEVTLPEEPMIFGIERTTNRPILQIDPMTGDVSHIFDTDINSHSLNGPNGLAYDSGRDTFYYVTYPYSATYGNATLFRYVRGETSAEEIFELDHELACADFYDGKYYYIAGGPNGATDDLYEVVFDGDGGVLEVNEFLGISGGLNFSWTFSGDIAISPEGVIFGVGLYAGKYQFFSVERDGTGFDLIDPNIGMPLQLAFSRDGVLFGNNLSDNSFYTVDLVTGDTEFTAASKSRAAFNDMASGIQYYNFENRELEEFDICGFKYGLDYTGFMMDTWPTDRPLEGWTIILERFEDDDWVEVASTPTDEVGKYCFLDQPAGEYRISEEFGDEIDGFWMKDGKNWLQVGPEGYHEFVLPDGDINEETTFDFYNLCYDDQTAWMFGDIEHNGLEGIKSNNWGWSLELKDVGDLVLDEPRELLAGIEIYAAAGQNDLDKGYLAGYLDICWDGENVVICNVEAEEWTYLDLEGMKVWVGNEELPKTKKGAYTNAPGQLVIQDGIDYNETVYVAVHFESFAPCEFTN